MKNENENYFDPEMKDDFKGMEGKILEEYDGKIIHNSYENWGYIKGYEPSESEKLMFMIHMQCYNISDGESNGHYIKESRDEYLKFLNEIYNKLISEGCKWCDN